MKKQNILLVAIIALLAVTLPLTTKAQTNVWSIGPEAGVSLSKYGNDANSNEFRPGPVVGLFVTYSIVNTFGLTTKLLYYEKGASFSARDSKQTLQYIEMPMIARFFLNKEGNIRPNIFIGPSIAVLAGARNTTDNDTEQIPSYKDTFNSVDLGVTGGLGCNFRIREETYFVVDTRYTHGVTDISKGDGNINNQSFAITAGLQFGIGN